MSRDPLPPGAACPCASGRTFGDCCAPLLEGRPATTAEALMRSRYCAYALHDDAYLLATWDPATRPVTATPSETPGLQWTGLRVVRCEAGQAGDETGMVEFIARYRQDAAAGVLHECSRFHRQQGRWVYCDGAHEAVPGRNAPCPCGSGDKYKRCCGR